MEKVKKQKLVDYYVYVADDGKEFTNEEECKLHERLLRGEIKTCPTCNGEGRTEEWHEWENYHTGAPEKILIHPICRNCHGKGYLEKKTIWQ